METTTGLPAPEQVQEFKLYVNNLPEELDQNGIREIFNEYGNIIGFFARPSSGWAYITYENYNEAENAIRDLHEKGPLHLQVTFAKQKSVDPKQRLLQSENNVVLHHSSPTESVQSRGPNYSAQVRQSLGHTGAMKFPQEKIPAPSYPSHGYTVEDDLLYPVPSDSQTYNPYTNEERFPSTNRLWTNGQLTITKDGKRHVSHGRGYTLYEIPEPHPKTQEHLTELYAKRMRGVYEYKRDMLNHSTGRCIKCQQLTKLTCARCHSYYCGTECQRSDWERHQLDCQPMSALIRTVASTSLSESSCEEKIQERQSHGVERTLRKPKRLIEEEKTQSGNGFTIPKEDTSLRPVKNQSAKTTNDDDFNFIPHKGYRSVNQSNSSYRKKLASQNSCQTLTTETDVHPPRSSTSPECRKPSLLDSDMFEPTQRIVNNKRSEKFDGARNTSTKRSFNDNFSNTKNDGSNGTANKQHNCIGTDVQNVTKDTAFQKDIFLSKTDFTNVRIVINCSSTTNTEYWVQKVEDTQKLANLMVNLQTDMRQAEKVNPKVGKLYAVKYETLWHRVQLTSENPKVVHFIDYGNSEIVTDDDFRNLDNSPKCNPLARKIRLSENVSAKYRNMKPEDTLSVRMVSDPMEDVIVVEVQGDRGTEKEVKSLDQKVDQELPMQTPQKPAQNVKLNVNPKTETKDVPSLDIQQLPSVLSMVKKGMEGFLEVHPPLENNSYGITFLPTDMASLFEKIMLTLPAACAETTVPTNYKPAINSLVCGQRDDGDWFRGYISNLGPPPRLLAVDDASTRPVTKSIPYPQEFKTVPTFGAICKLLNTDDKLTPGQQCTFIVVGCKKDAKNQDIVEILINVDDRKVQALVRPLRIAPEQRGISFAELKSGSEVYITTGCGAATMYVQSLDSKLVEHFHRVMQAVQKCAQTAEKVEKPVIGQIVIAPFSDNNKYRAIVTKIIGEKVAVSYVDFGNSEFISISNLQILSDELKLLPSCSTKVVLKDVPRDSALTQEASAYVNHLVGKEVRLICTFDGVPSKDGVYLETHNGESVNKKLIKLLTPSYNRGEEEDKTVYMSYHMTIGTLGDVGDIVTAIVLYEMTPGSHYGLCLKNPELMTHILTVMQPSINKYCESTSYYIPRTEELCLALYEGDWYRAICVQPKTECAVVYFVDYGNAEVVDFKNIRLMPKDFVTPEAMGNCCRIVAPGGKSYNEDHEKIISTLIRPNESVRIKVVKIIDRGVYEVEVPDVHEILSLDKVHL